MEQGAEPPLPHFSRQDRRHVVVGVARMDDERQVELAGKRDMAAKDPLSDVARRAVVVIVEARLADPDAFGMSGECAHGVEILRVLPGRLMRMRADGEEHVVVPLRDRDHARGLRHFRADGDHALDAGRARALDDRVEVVGEVGKIEVAMAVDERHSAPASAQALTSPPPLRHSEERPAWAGAAPCPARADAARSRFADLDVSPASSAANVRASGGTPRRSRSAPMLAGIDRLQQDRGDPQGFDRHVEHEPHARGIALGELPWLGVGEIAIGLRDDLENARRCRDAARKLCMCRRASPRSASARASIARSPHRPAPSARQSGTCARRSSWRSWSASAAPDCRCRWRDRRSCGRRSPHASSCRPGRTGLPAGRNSAPRRARKPRPSPSGSTTLPTDFDIFSPRLNRKPCTTTCFGTGSPADIRKAGQ